MAYRIYRVLVFPGNTGIGLEINDALHNLKEVQLIGASSTCGTHGPLAYRHYYDNLPFWYESEALISSLNELIEREKIDCIFPAYDDVINVLAEHQSELGAKVISSPLDLCAVARLKTKTYEALQGQHARVIHDELQMRAHLETCPASLILEYLPGPEYTVDCFADRERGLLFVGIRERVRVRAGISMRTEPVDCPEVEAMAQAIWDRLPFQGAWFFQVKSDVNGRPKLLEVAPRIAGAMALYRNLGINFPLLSVYEAYRLPVRLIQNDFTLVLDKAFVNRFQTDLHYTRVYVDLDDTLILNGQVNVCLIMFLYQCLNRGTQLILITRTTSNIDELLAKHRLAGLFDTIIQLAPGEKKSAYILPDSIFIDDSFAERKDVFDRCHIPVFDCSMIESLLDHRS
jgi:hypothetical protein